MVDHFIAGYQKLHAISPAPGWQKLTTEKMTEWYADLEMSNFSSVYVLQFGRRTQLRRFNQRWITTWRHQPHLNHHMWRMWKKIPLRWSLRDVIPAVSSFDSRNFTDTEEVNCLKLRCHDIFIQLCNGESLFSVTQRLAMLCSQLNLPGPIYINGLHLQIVLLRTNTISWNSKVMYC